MAKLILATDWEGLRGQMAATLESAGHQVLQLPGDANLIIEKMDAFRPDLYLLDLVMLSDTRLAYAGVRAVGKIKLVRADAKMIIFTSVDRMREEVLKAEKEGAQGYLHVPFPPEALLREVERVLALSA